MYLQHNSSGPSISCPNCGCIVDIEEALGRKVEQELKEEMLSIRKDLEGQFQKKEADLKKQEAEFLQRKQRENELFNERLEKEKEKLNTALQARIKQDFSLLLNEKEKEIEETTNKLVKMQQAEIENAKLKRTLETQQKDMELQFEQRLNDQLRLYEKQIATRESGRLEMQLREKDMQLEVQKKLIDELKRKSIQGSVQLQGEVQEMAISDWLKSQFPYDSIEEIRSGARGADCLQTVFTREHRNCGTIYYESKRTKDFQPAWIEKFKEDMRSKGADLGVIVTQAMPRDMHTMGEINGIWICTYEEFKGLSLVLREMLQRIHTATSAQINKSDKMELLYTFLTSQEFKMYLEAVVEGFTQMQSDLNKEKTAMQKLWHQREKQIRKVLESTAAMVGSIQGIAGNMLPEIAQLQLTDERDNA